MIAIALMLLGLFFAPLVGIAAETKAASQKDWKAALSGGQKEGRVVLYGSVVYEEIFREFQKKYPGIKVNAVTGRTPELAERILTERRAEIPRASLLRRLRPRIRLAPGRGRPSTS